MVEVDEKEVYHAFLKYKGTGKVDIGGAEISVTLNPVDIHKVDSPDCILWVKLSIRVMGQNLKLKIPIPVEAEKGGIYGGALEDLRKFVERKKYLVEIPMLVVAEAGYDTREQSEILPVKFIISQIPVRLIKEER